MKVTVNQAIKLTYSALSSLVSPGKTAKVLPKVQSPKYPEIYVFRHGETYDNRNRMFSGRRDSKLTPAGINQAKILNEKLDHKKIDICFVSSLSRSIGTARTALRDHKVKFITDDRIIERDYGDLSGKSKDKFTEDNTVEGVKYRRFYDFKPPNGESLKDVVDRVYPFCEELVNRMRATGENVALSCHGNSMKAIRMYFEKLSPMEALTQENPLGQDYAEYVIEPNKIIVKKSASKGETLGS